MVRTRKGFTVDAKNLSQVGQDQMLSHIIKGILQLAYRLDVHGLCRYIDESAEYIKEDFLYECTDTLYELIVESDKLFAKEPFNNLANIEKKRLEACRQAHLAQLDDCKPDIPEHFYYYLDLIDIRRGMLIGSGRIGNEDSSKAVDHIHNTVVRLTKERLARYVS